MTFVTKLYPDFSMVFKKIIKLRDFSSIRRGSSDDETNNEEVDIDEGDVITDNLGQIGR